MLVETFENNGKNISKKIVKLNLERNINQGGQQFLNSLNSLNCSWIVTGFWKTLEIMSFFKDIKTLYKYIYI